MKQTLRPVGVLLLWLGLQSSAFAAEGTLKDLHCKGEPNPRPPIERDKFGAAQGNIERSDLLHYAVKTYGKPDSCAWDDHGREGWSNHTLTYKFPRGVRFDHSSQGDEIVVTDEVLALPKAIDRAAALAILKPILFAFKKDCKVDWDKPWGGKDNPQALFSCEQDSTISVFIPRSGPIVWVGEKFRVD